MEIIVALIFVILYFCIFRESSKGDRGERTIANILSKLPSSEYSVINDLIIQNEHHSTQIDHVIISIYGIFVIETKNYSGWIMGGEKSDQWIKNMYGRKYYFYNPIKQNYGHISSLAKELLIPKDSFISIIAFPNTADIKVHTNEHVIYFKEILPTIYSYSFKKLSISEVNRITNKLSQQISSKEQTKRHVQFVKEKKNFSKNAFQRGICPYCGATLKIRNGKYGAFIGCSRYPKCTYKHPL